MRAHSAGGRIATLRDDGSVVLRDEVAVEVAPGRLATLDELVITGGREHFPAARKGDRILVRGPLVRPPDSPRNRMARVIRARKGNETLLPFYVGAANERVAARGSLTELLPATERAPARVVIAGGYLTNLATSRSIQFDVVECVAARRIDGDEARLRELIGTRIALRGVARFGLIDVGLKARIEDVDHPRLRT